MNLFELYFSGVCALRFHPRNCSVDMSLDAMLTELDFAVSIASLMCHLTTFRNVVMSNPYAPLVRMIELRIARQEASLSESKLQLDAALQAQASFSEGDKPQVDAFGKAAKAAGGTRST